MIAAQTTSDVVTGGVIAGVALLAVIWWLRGVVGLALVVGITAVGRVFFATNAEQLDEQQSIGLTAVAAIVAVVIVLMLPIRRRA